MKSTKPPLTFIQQAKLLASRGLVADRGDLEIFLSNVNYYRFSGYLYPFRSKVGDNYLPGTTLEQIRNIYNFDSELRLLTLSAIEIIEIALLRTRMVECFSITHGAFCYTDINCFGSRLSKFDHIEMLDNIERNVDRSTEEFVSLYRAKYTSEPHLPFWMVAETCTFGQLSKIFYYLPHKVKVTLAMQFDLHYRDLGSWLHALSVARNICAHHARLWNRRLPVKPSIPSIKYHPEFYSPVKVSNDSYFVILAMLEYLVKTIYPDKSIKNDFEKLFVKYPGVPINKMGFPKNWHECAVFVKQK